MLDGRLPAGGCVGKLEPRALARRECGRARFVGAKPVILLTAVMPP